MLKNITLKDVIVEDINVERFCNGLWLLGFGYAYVDIGGNARQVKILVSDDVDYADNVLDKLNKLVAKFEGEWV